MVSTGDCLEKEGDIRAFLLNTVRCFSEVTASPDKDLFFFCGVTLKNMKVPILHFFLEKILITFPITKPNTCKLYILYGL